MDSQDIYLLVSNQAYIVNVALVCIGLIESFGDYSLSDVVLRPFSTIGLLADNELSGIQSKT
jgi:hypothetical protein